MTENLESLATHEQVLLNMEDIIEERIEIDQEACAGLDRDWKELYDGECSTCGRVYEAEHLVSPDTQTGPSDCSSGQGDCIPCWREKNDLPKIDPDEHEELAE